MNFKFNKASRAMFVVLSEYRSESSPENPKDGDFWVTRDFFNNLLIYVRDCKFEVWHLAAIIVEYSKNRYGMFDMYDDFQYTIPDDFQYEQYCKLNVASLCDKLKNYSSTPIYIKDGNFFFFSDETTNHADEPCEKEINERYERLLEFIEI